MKINNEYIKKFLMEVHDGTTVTVVEPSTNGFWMLAVPNPDYKDDNGKDPYLVLKVMES